MKDEQEEKKLTNADLVKLLDDRILRYVWENMMNKSEDEWFEWLKKPAIGEGQIDDLR